MNKFWKWFLIILAILAIPIIIFVIVLYANDGYYLAKFNTWISKPGNLSAFISCCVAYLPLVNVCWMIGLNIVRTRIIGSEYKRHKASKSKTIYDDKKHNSIYYDKEENKFYITWKVPDTRDAKSGAHLVGTELKARLQDWLDREAGKVK